MEVNKLLVDCVECDVRNITKTILESYEEIRIEATKVISNANANELMASYPVTIDATDIVCLPLNGEVISINGKKKIAGGEIDRPVSLIVNGMVEIEKDAEKSLKNIISMHVNGMLVYPSTLEGMLPALQLNGAAEVYPGDAIRLKNAVEIDEIFLMRAKPEKYYASKHIVILDSQLDIAALHENTIFLTKKAYIAKSLLSDAVGHFEDETEIEVVADGTAWVKESIVLDESTIQQYGTKLLVTGDMVILKDSALALEKIEFLHVTGKLIVDETLIAKIAEKKVTYKKCVKCQGAVILEQEEVHIDEFFAKKYDKGATLVDCDMIMLAEEIAAEWIDQHLKIIDCGLVKCTKEQRAAVKEIACDTGILITGEEDEGEEEEEKRDEKYKDWKIVDAVTYVF